MDSGFMRLTADCRSLATGVDFEHSIPDVQQAQDGRKKGSEFAQGNDF